MTDRELEGRLRALYRDRVPAEVAAPIELHAGLVAITRASSPAERSGGTRAWALLAAAALLATLLIGGALVAGSGLLRSTSVVSPRSPLPTSAAATPMPTYAPAFFGGWRPKDRGIHPAGIYSWDLGSPTWMHKVRDGSGSVELSFRLTTRPNELKALADALASDGDGPDPEHPVEIPGLTVQTWVAEDSGMVGQVAPGEPPRPTSGTSKAPQTYLMGIGGRVVTVEQGAPGESAPPSSQIAMATQTWLMDIDGRVVAFDVTTYGDTTPALLAEAEAVIRSVRPRQPDPAATPAPSGYPSPFHGFVFELTPGWDAN